jgi:hypothetical protein
LWKIESDEEYYRIFDSKKLIAGYFDPDYGDIFPKDNASEIILSMQKNHDPILGGMLMIPMVKFRLFDTDLDTDITNVEQNVSRVSGHLIKWKAFLSKINSKMHSIRISHTDQDMLTITFPIIFSKPTPLEKQQLLQEISSTLDLLQTSDLL